MPAQIEAWFFNQNLPISNVHETPTYMDIESNYQHFRYFKKSGILKHLENARWIELNTKQAEDIPLF